MTAQQESDLFNHEYDKITDRIGRDKVLIPINHNYSKICDILGFFKLKTQEIVRAFSLVMKKKPFKCMWDGHTVQLQA